MQAFLTCALHVQSRGLHQSGTPRMLCAMVKVSFDICSCPITTSGLSDAYAHDLGKGGSPGTCQGPHVPSTPAARCASTGTHVSAGERRRERCSTRATAPEKPPTDVRVHSEMCHTREAEPRPSPATNCAARAQKGWESYGDEWHGSAVPAPIAGLVHELVALQGHPRDVQGALEGALDCTSYEGPCVTCTGLSALPPSCTQNSL